MRPVLLNGFYTGRYEFLNYTGTSSVPISSFNSNIYAVIGLNSERAGYTFYYPNSSTNELTHFVSGQNYIVFTKSSFTIPVTGADINRLDVKSNTLSGQITLAYYPFTNSLPFSSYNSHLIEIFATNKLLLSGSRVTTLSALTASIDGAVLLSYQPDRTINAETHFKQGQTYIIKAKSDFIVYNPDVSALLQENGEYLFLENDELDRLLTE